MAAAVCLAGGTASSFKPVHAGGAAGWLSLDADGAVQAPRVDWKSDGCFLRRCLQTKSFTCPPANTISRLMQKYPKISLFGTIVLALALSACAWTNPLPSVQTDRSEPVTAPDSLNVVQLEPMHSTVILQRVATAEQRTLSRLATELRFVLNLVRESQAQADPDARIRFDYGLLIRDLRNMIAGIEAHAVPSSASLDSIEPIPGDYLR